MIQYKFNVMEKLKEIGYNSKRLRTFRRILHDAIKKRKPCVLEDHRHTLQTLKLSSRGFSRIRGRRHARNRRIALLAYSNRKEGVCAVSPLKRPEGQQVSVIGGRYSGFFWKNSIF